MTSASLLRLNEQRLSETSREHALDSAVSLRELLQKDWPQIGTEELEMRVLELEVLLIKAAIFLRRYQGNNGGQKDTCIKNTSIKHPFVAFAEGNVRAADLRLVANKIVHHKWLHAEDSGSSKIETITSECDRGKFTKFKVNHFSEAIIAELRKANSWEP